MKIEDPYIHPLDLYTRSERALTPSLCSLPFALINSFGFTTGPVLFLLSCTLFGVDVEIGYAIGHRHASYRSSLTMPITVVSKGPVSRIIAAIQIMREYANVLGDEAILQALTLSLLTQQNDTKMRR